MEDDNIVVDRIKAETEISDNWNGIKGVKGIDESLSLWNCHPFYFLETMDKLGLLEVNPYLGETFDMVKKAGAYEPAENKSVMVVKGKGAFAFRGKTDRFKCYSQSLSSSKNI